MRWKILIVDDEEPAREELAYMLGLQKEIGSVLHAQSGMEAIKKAKEHQPNLIFLDIELPDFNGLKVAEIIAEMEIECKIVFLTAYDQYAVEAFKLRAFHYILKPFDEEDLQHVFQQLERDSTKSSDSAVVACSAKLAVEIDGGIRFLSPKDIMYISKKKEDRGIILHTVDNDLETHSTLQDLEKKLTPYSFFRVHKSFLVNLEYVHELQPFFHGSYNLYLKDKDCTAIPVSRNYVKELRLRLEL